MGARLGLDAAMFFALKKMKTAEGKPFVYCISGGGSLMFDDLPEERRREIRSIKSEEEYKKLTPHEMTYYRLTAPMAFASVPDSTPSISKEELEDFLKNGGTLIIPRRESE